MKIDLNALQNGIDEKAKLSTEKAPVDNSFSGQWWHTKIENLQEVISIIVASATSTGSKTAAMMTVREMVPGCDIVCARQFVTWCIEFTRDGSRISQSHPSSKNG